MYVVLSGIWIIWTLYSKHRSFWEHRDSGGKQFVKKMEKEVMGKENNKGTAVCQRGEKVFFREEDTF